MAEEKTTTAPAKADAPEKAAPKKGRDAGSRGRRPGRRGGPRRHREPREFEQRMLDLSRVTRVTAGGKRMRFRAALAIGDKKGRVGFGVAKGLDVQGAIQKAYTQAKKNLVNVKTINETLPHAYEARFSSTRVLLKPAPKGTGLKSGGAVREILALAGVSNAVSKILNGQNKINVAKATLKALESMVVPEGVLTDTEARATERKEKRAQATKKVSKKAAEKSENAKA